LQVIDAMKLNSIEEIIEDFRQGKMVIIMDDEDRENEGDLVMAANLVSPEDINFMARYGRGLICLTLTQERCQQLKLPLMVGSTGDLHGTNFTVSIEAAEGVTTGISAADRATTIKAAVKEDAGPNDIVQPGHIFPLMAQPGGVLVRAGHTEAGCDLARLAGHEPSAVIVEILNEDGTMARRPDLENFAKEHDLKIGTIEELISYKIKNEKTVERVAESDFTTEYGNFRLHAYQNSLDGGLHFALVHGKIGNDQPVLVRVHVENTLIDLLGSTRATGWPLRSALKQVAQSDCGVVVVIRQPEEDNAIINWMLRHPTSESEAVEQKPDLRKDGVGAQMLMDLGVRKMRLMSAPKVYHGLAGFNLEVVEYVSGDQDQYE
jgi:3,4-dihydroxy 2-butanone 4-phosphate synthase/GTP cyclohydrolase II